MTKSVDNSTPPAAPAGLPAGSRHWKGPIRKADRPSFQRAFLEALADRGTVRMAARQAGINPDTAFVWRSKDPEFAAAWDAAIETVHDEMESNMVDMARKQEGMMSFHAGKLWLVTHRKKWREQPAETAVEILSRTLEGFVMALRESRSGSGTAALPSPPYAAQVEAGGPGGG